LKVPATGILIVLMINSLFVYSSPLKKIPHTIPAGKRNMQPDTTMKALSPKKEGNQPVKAENTDTTPLDESLVVSYSKKKNEAAHPQTGWANFKKYIQDKAVSPDGKTGDTELSFTVNTNGALSDFKIIKSLGDRTDKTAIEIIKNGPSWVGQADGPKPVTLKVTFVKALNP